MIWISWLAQHWFDILQTVGIVGGLFFTGWSLHVDAQTQRAANLLNITVQHREIWKILYSEPKLARVLEPKIDFSKDPISDDEARFVGFLILHLNASFQAIKAGVLMRSEGLATDIQEFFALPIPKAVWERIKVFYDSDFVSFIESAKKSAPNLKGTL